VNLLASVARGDGWTVVPSLLRRFPQPEGVAYRRLKPPAADITYEIVSSETLMRDPGLRAVLAEAHRGGRRIDEAGVLRTSEDSA
jgi:DNA-binding transcriptional LysR family regulator